MIFAMEASLEMGLSDLSADETELRRRAIESIRRSQISFISEDEERGGFLFAKE